MNPTELMLAAVQSERESRLLFEPISHEQAIALGRTYTARRARRAARAATIRGLGAAVRQRVGAVMPGTAERPAPALRA